MDTEFLFDQLKTTG